MIGNKPLIYCSAICVRGINGDVRLLTVEVGRYLSIPLARREIESTKPPEVLRPYRVLAVAPTASVRKELVKYSRNTGIPIAKEQRLAETQSQQIARRKKTDQAKVTVL
jgi:hypothetical protein